MATVNAARFTINATASEDAGGNRGFTAINSQTLTVQIEASPTPALAVRFDIFDPADSESPLASKGAPNLTWVENSLPSILLSLPTDTATIDMPASGVVSYLIRCTVSLPGSSPAEQVQVFERLVVIRSLITTPAVRKTVPAESVEFIARAWSDAINDMVEVLDSGAMGADSLQSAYALGNTISVTAGNGAVEIDNSTDLANSLTLDRTFAGAGDALRIGMGNGGEAVAGTGISLTGGVAATGRMLFIKGDSTSAESVRVEKGESTIFLIDGPGAIDIHPFSGENLDIEVAGAGVLDVDSTGAITIDCSAAGISLDAAAASNFSTSAGNLTLDAAAGELVFDDVGNSGLELSQSADRTLDQAAAGEVLNGASSLVGAINRLARAMDAAGQAGIRDYVVVDGVTITAGDCVAQSSVAGRATQANANNDTQSEFIGVALTTGTGDVGGTISVRVALPGNFVTDSGGAFTAGDALFMPDGTGRVTSTAPAGSGDIVQRIGWAHSSTQYVIDPGQAVELV